MKRREFLLVVPLWIFFLFYINAQSGKSKQSDFPVLKGPYFGQTPPGDTPELFMPGIISDCDLHSSVYFSPDGNEVYFSKLHLQKGSNTWDIMFMKQENGRWTQPQFLCQGLTPFLSPDGNTLFFSTEKWFLWKMEKSSMGWNEPVKLSNAINFARRQDGPSVTRNGTLYYGTNYQNAKGIVRSTLKDGRYTEPLTLESEINSNNTEGFPFIAPDESYIIFTSFRPGSFGMGDLYISFRKSNGGWTKAVNLGPKINTTAKERFPFVSLDGKYLFFNSNRVSELNAKPIPDGPGNIYWVSAKIIEELRPMR